MSFHLIFNYKYNIYHNISCNRIIKSVKLVRSSRFMVSPGVFL